MYHPLSIGTLFVSCMSRMTEYIAIEDDNVISPNRSNFQKGNDQLHGMRCNVTISEAIQLHCLAMRLLSDSQNLQKVGHGIVIFNGNVLGHA